jgi:hypothetical protein
MKFAHGHDRRAAFATAVLGHVKTAQRPFTQHAELLVVAKGPRSFLFYEIYQCTPPG